MKIQLFKVLIAGTKASFTHYFRVRADNGEIIVQSEGYTTKRARNKTVRLISRADWAHMPVQDLGEAERWQ